jgi:DNA-directed RNA polymerase
MCLAHGMTRTVVKRNVMTYSYSSRKFGMAQQQQEDLMEPLRLEVLSGKREEHPFGDSKSTQFAAARYLAGKVFEAIETVVRLPAEAMTYLQKLARALAHEGKPLEWTTPTGLPWSNRYHATTTKNVRLWLHDKGVVRRTKVAVGYEKEIDKDKASNGVAPNFVHALDAAHLLMTVNAAVKEDIVAFALVHDSFGCLASRAERFHGVIREQFVKLYSEHDVLAEVMEQAKCDLTQHNWDRLPPVVVPGTLEHRGGS